MFRGVLVALIAALVAAVPARAATADQPWPPAAGKGVLFAHFGEEHINDADGGTLMPAAVASVVRYEPRLLTLSGDKADNGEVEQFHLWMKAMEPLDAAGIPWLAGAGNHDRTAPPGAPGGVVGLFGLTLPDSFDIYKAEFAKRPYPMGDAAPYPGIGPAARPADDPAGAAATYVADVAGVRWIFLDNSCWSLTGCDAFQARADGGSDTQLEFLRAKAKEASDAGKVVFVVMHIPTADPRDQSYTDTTAQTHVMGKGTSSDNADFQGIAHQTGVDGVFVGHIKGQFLYRAGDVPYYIDGGVGGELYTTGPVGVDHGYWHGYRLIRVDGTDIVTDSIPTIVPGGIRIEGPDTLGRGDLATFAGFAKQPVVNDPAKVERLELRDPAPRPRPGRRATLLGLTGEDLALLGPALLLLAGVPLALLWPARRRVAVGLGVVLLGGAGGATFAVAQQEVPTSTGVSALPNPSRIWTTADAGVLAPVASETDDPRRDARTQTADGAFTAVCPGRVALSVTSGWEAASTTVTVPSARGRIVRSVRRSRTLRRGRKAEVARVRLAQPARVSITVRRGRTVVKRAPRKCAATSRSLRWSPRRTGRYTVEIRIASDRATDVRRSTLTVR